MTGWLVSDGMCGDIYDVIPDNKASILFQMGGLKADSTYSGNCGSGQFATVPWMGTFLEVSLCTNLCRPGGVSSVIASQYLSSPACAGDASYAYLYRQFKAREFFRCEQPGSTVKLRVRGSWAADNCIDRSIPDSYFQFAATYYSDDLSSSGGTALSPNPDATLNNRTWSPGPMSCRWGCFPSIIIEIGPNGTIIGAPTIDDNWPIPSCG